MGRLIEDKFKQWEEECNHRFDTLKANEEELNRIFIDIYGLGDELTPEVADKDVTVAKANLKRDIKSLVSYAVGCMFGRYSPYKDGLIFAGGEWNMDDYTRICLAAINTDKNISTKMFMPDVDNVLPIPDDDYLENDIVSRFVEFVSLIYGNDTLEKNLDYIAKALGNKGDTSRKVIRNYFLNDFYNDHVKTYQKRPIYWQLDSGKNNGFKALIYMHRYNQDTMGIARVDYLHKLQRIYESLLSRLDDTIDNNNSVRDVAEAQKKKEAL
ncbi:MAG: restriction endonuclease, partial [Clostridia bacterium]